MGKNIKATLANNGYDTNAYLSLQIEKGSLPNGGEVVVMIRETKTGDLRPIAFEQSCDKVGFAQSSRFYQKVMADGHLFNPYIHRRYIAAQFRRLIRAHGCAGIKQAVARSYRWDYAVGILRSEVHKLANLAKHDYAGYVERSRFFTLERCKHIIADYVSDASRYIDRVMSVNDHAFYRGYGSVKKENVRPMKYRFAKLAEQANACGNYKQLDDLLSGFEWLELSSDLSLHASFVEPFVESGAYYTIKHHMMFEGLCMWGYSQQKSLEQLAKYNGSYLDLYQSIMY